MVVGKVPHRPVVNTMKLTTLSLLEKQDMFSLLDTVYPEAMGGGTSPLSVKA